MESEGTELERISSLFAHDALEDDESLDLYSHVWNLIRDAYIAGWNNGRDEATRKAHTAPDHGRSDTPPKPGEPFVL